MGRKLLLHGREVCQHPKPVRPPRAGADLRAQAEAVLREVAYVLHLTRRVTTAITTGTRAGQSS
jgi:hypothetical protein